MADANNNTTVIGLGTRIKGEMTFDGTARILGEFEGRITSPGEVQVGESATCKAAIEGAVVVVDGVIEGNITARQRLLLNPSAKVAGDVVATSMTVVEGATLVGHCRIGGEFGPGSGAGAKPGAAEAGAPKPRIVMGGAVANGKQNPTEMETSLAGLESKIAGLGRPKQSGAGE